MSVVRSITGYRMSRDYALLWRLAHKQSVVCVCDYSKDCRDVAQTICRNEGAEVAICARGIEYVCAYTVESFFARCAQYVVEFVVPEDTSC